MTAGALTTQLMLGCHPAEEKDTTPGIATITIPSGLEQPGPLVGKWQEAKGKQTVQLNKDGTCEIISKVTISAAATKGAARSFDQATSAKWGVKDKEFYFDVKDSLPLKYEWSENSSGDKFTLSNSGSKLTYTKLSEKK